MPGNESRLIQRNWRKGINLTLFVRKLNFGCKRLAGLIAFQVVKLVEDSHRILAINLIFHWHRDLEPFVDERVRFIQQSSLEILN